MRVFNFCYGREKVGNSVYYLIYTFADNAVCNGSYLKMSVKELKSSNMRVHNLGIKGGRVSVNSRNPTHLDEYGHSVLGWIFSESRSAYHYGMYLIDSNGLIQKLNGLSVDDICQTARDKGIAHPFHNITVVKYNSKFEYYCCCNTGFIKIYEE